MSAYGVYVRAYSTYRLVGVTLLLQSLFVLD